MVAELEELAVAAGATRLLLKPHSYLEAFYQRLGFVTLEGAETVAAHELIVMGKELRPPSDDRASRRRGRQKLEP